MKEIQSEIKKEKINFNLIAPEDIILKPVFTEKAYKLAEKKKFVFVVRLDATKPQIKRAVEKMFGVKVKKVNTMIYRGKIKRRGLFLGHRPSFKKAIVTIEGQLDIRKISEKFSSAATK
jgi:large subunit ribosomal protein L23